MTAEVAENKTADTEVADTAAENAAAQAAFGAMRGAEPPAKVETAVTPEASAVVAETKLEPTEAERAKAAEDEWLKTVPQSIRDNLTAVSGVSNRLRNIEGHIGGLTSQTKEIKAALTAAKTAAVAAGGDTPTDAQVAAATTGEKWKQMKEDFPEWADAMEERIGSIRGSAVDVDGIAKKVTEGFAPALAGVEMRARQFARVDMVHEDWENTVNTPEFSTWLQGQPDDIKALSSSAFAKDAIKLLNTYADHSKPKDTPAAPPAKLTPQDRLATAVTPTRGNGQPIRTEPTEQEAAAAAFKRVRGG